MQLRLFIGSDNDVYLENVTDSKTGDPVGAATINWQLKDSSGTNVSGGSGAATLVAGTDSDYELVVPSSVALTENAVYRMHLTVSIGSKDILARPTFRAVYYEGDEE